MASIFINADQWNSISVEEQKKISEGLRNSGALKAGDSIVGDASTPAFDPKMEIQIQWNPIRDICNIACDVAAGTAVTWCTVNTVGLGLVVCLAAAEAGRSKCRENC